MHTIFNGFLALVIMYWPLKASPFCCSTNPQNKRWHWRRGDARHLSIKDVPVKGIRCALYRSKTWMTRTRTRATATPLVPVISSQHFPVSEKGLTKTCSVPICFAESAAILQSILRILALHRSEVTAGIPFWNNSRHIFCRPHELCPMDLGRPDPAGDVKETFLLGPAALGFPPCRRRTWTSAPREVCSYVDMDSTRR